ncbi:D-alanyl-D-alanine carboxypeptidase [Cryobacterium sp. MDB1-18-2]|uniref:D-alanyl-D-alanine carboxypeptidase family protein n=1 Tax=unclassified Cryobacterium TaxID=2649013 RepID=UPI00106C36DC|nr:MULTISPECIES: D-alanyl-D-alanine carboxypeptidase [unclassified Cryobacterium]TFC25360.1 D-alanyl-D-alanine carboxypeptidase [Cryobacterium sp. MDB1-18-2]TFC43553.1 D-alanyl-D-alanine carboxypeptidase [Cryobacterium sp. MDB1-18-1]
MPSASRSTILRRRFAVLGGLLVVILLGGYFATTSAAALPASSATLTQPAALTQPATAMKWPGIGEGAIGAVGYDGVLGSSGSQSAVPIASITKMVTSLVLLEAKPLAATEAGPDVKFTDADVQIYYDVLAQDGSVAPVVSGMVLSQRQALEGMLLPSANNYSITLANWAFGSVDAYLKVARAWLTDHGLTGTTIADTSGISPLSASTPADLVEIGKLVLKNPALASIVSEKTATLPTIGTVTNTNEMLGEHGVDGIKTGTTDEAGACLLFSADFTVGDTTVTLVGVLLGGTTHDTLDADIGRLIESVKPGFREVTLTEAGASYGTYASVWGQNGSVVAAEKASALVWSDTAVTGVATARSVGVGSDGDAVGSLDFVVGTQKISVPLVLDGTLSDPGPGWRFTHPGELLASR